MLHPRQKYRAPNLAERRFFFARERRACRMNCVRQPGCADFCLSSQEPACGKLDFDHRRSRSQSHAPEGRRWRCPFVEVSALIDQWRRGSARQRASSGATCLFPSVEALQGEIDGTLVATQNHARFRSRQGAVERAGPRLVEKPLTRVSPKPTIVALGRANGTSVADRYLDTAPRRTSSSAARLSPTERFGKVKSFRTSQNRRTARPVKGCMVAGGR